MSARATPAERLYAIVEQGLCIGCGLCQSIAGEARVRLCKTAGGELRPLVEGELDDATVDRIYAACPGTRVEGLPLELLAGDTHQDNVWGPWRRMLRGWAADPQLRYEGSTGGVLTALATYLLTSGRVEFVLQVRASSTEPSFGEAVLSFDEADVLAAAGSRYGPAAPLVNIAAVLDRGEAFAFVAKPCDVAALRNYARQDARVDALLKYCLVMICGGYGTTRGTLDFYRRVGIEAQQVSALRYRGRGCPGPTRVETADGRVREFHYIDYWGEDESSWNLPFRCKLCPDGIGEAADIAAGDTWIGGGPDRAGSADDPGINSIIARTRAGEELIAAAIADGALQPEYDIVPDTLSLYQPHQVNKKYAAWARHQGLGDAGRIVPQTSRLRIEQLARELSPASIEYQRRGTLERVRAGKADEPRPQAAPPLMKSEERA